MTKSNKIVVIQTAFIGDVILSTALLETLHLNFPDTKIDLVVRKGNESLFHQHPFINKVWTWDKKNGKFKNLITLGLQLRKEKYDWSITLQRYFSAGLLTLITGAKLTCGFRKNPFSIFFTFRAKHRWGNHVHEIDRNHDLIQDFVHQFVNRPVLYPTTEAYEKVKPYIKDSYICLAPNSVWYTKQWPLEHWVKLIQHYPKETTIYLVGAPNDKPSCDEIAQKSGHPRVEVLAGKHQLIETAALFSKASLVVANDSGPLHLASAVDVPTVAIFCSTSPSFGFGPLAHKHVVIETKENLDCKPCGMHGKKACPKGHFKCGLGLSPKSVYEQCQQLINAS
ncbi:MAG: lipopolysaccharide heptosyltransferase II [Cytophagaceae bacterium]